MFHALAHICVYDMLQIDHVGSMMDNDVRRNEQEGITVSPPTRSKGQQLIFDNIPFSTKRKIIDYFPIESTYPQFLPMMGPGNFEFPNTSPKPNGDNNRNTRT
jgi:hypothetical protein